MGKVSFKEYKDYPQATNVSMNFAFLSRIVSPVSLLVAVGVIFVIPGIDKLPTVMVVALFIGIVVALTFGGSKLLVMLEEKAVERAIMRANEEYRNQQIFYCPKCGRIYEFDKTIATAECPQCRKNLYKTNATKVDWIRMTEPQKSEKKQYWKALAYAPPKKAPHTTQHASPVTQIKQYKELLDMGIITQQEFDNKKKELLNL